MYTYWLELIVHVILRRQRNDRLSVELRWLDVLSCTMSNRGRHDRLIATVVSSTTETIRGRANVYPADSCPCPVGFRTSRLNGRPSDVAVLLQAANLLTIPF